MLLKSIRLAGQLIETRLLMRHPDGVWAGYTYEWNRRRRPATRVIGGKTRQVGGQTWIYPSEGECMQCHTAAAGFSLGPETAQLNGHLIYPATSRTANQLATLATIGMFSAPLPGPPGSLPALADPADPAQPLDGPGAGLAAHQLRPVSPAGRADPFQHGSALHDAAGGDEHLQRDAPGGQPGHCQRTADRAGRRRPFRRDCPRMNRRDAQGMPPIGSNLVDAAGVSLLTAWVNSLSGC